MRRNPFAYGMYRRPRRLTWYSVITQVFTLIGRLVGRAATSRAGGVAVSSRGGAKSRARKSRG